MSQFKRAFEWDLTVDKVVHRRADGRTVEIGLNDIKSLYETRGWIMVTGGEPAALITIPSDLEGFEQIRPELIARCTAACSELNHGKTGDFFESGADFPSARKNRETTLLSR